MIENLDQLCKFFAPVFEGMGLRAPNAMDVLDYVRNEEEANMHLANRHLQATANRRPIERLPMLDEDGYDYGRVTDEIPEDIYFNLRKRYGAEAMSSSEGRKEVLKAFPQFKVKTVSGKTVSGWTPTSARGGCGINFSRANFNGLALAAQ